MPSYSPVFSEQFILSDEALGYPSFLVPAGFTAVVRDFSAFTADGVELAQVLIQNSGAAPAIVVASVGSILAAGYGQWQGRAVCPGGGTISVSLTYLLGGPDVYVGGYLLRNNLT